MTTRETSFQESEHPGTVFPGKKPSGKVTIRETTVNLVCAPHPRYRFVLCARRISSNSV